VLGVECAAQGRPSWDLSFALPDERTKFELTGLLDRQLSTSGVNPDNPRLTPAPRQADRAARSKPPFCGSGEVEAILVHDLGPGRYDLLPSVTPQLRKDL
jgi:hypothetical protein